MAIPAGWWTTNYWPSGETGVGAKFSWWPEKWFPDDYWPSLFWGVETYEYWQERWWPRYSDVGGVFVGVGTVAEAVVLGQFVDRSLEVGAGGVLLTGAVTETFNVGEDGYRFGSLVRQTNVLVTDAVVGALLIPAAVAESLYLAQDDERLYSVGEVARSELNVTVWVRSTVPYTARTLQGVVSETVRFRFPGGRSGDRSWVPRDIDSVVPDVEADLPIREE